MAQRVEPRDSADDFPTPPWATRALIKYVVSDQQQLATLTCLEPACGAGHMSKVLRRIFLEGGSSDAYSYGYAPARDFLAEPYQERTYDWVITNPPFRLAERYLLEAFKVSRIGVAVLARTVFLESVGRYNALFRKTPHEICTICQAGANVKGATRWEGNNSCGLCLVRVGETRRP